VKRPLGDFIGESPRVAVVLGSGLGELASSLSGGEPVPYSQIEGFSDVTVAGHSGSLYSGEIRGVETVVLAGRVHLYEGHEPQAVVHAVGTLVGEGVEVVILTNAAGGINPDFEVGSLCLIGDHLNLTGTNPFIGPHDSRGPRFLDLTEVYDARLRALAHEADPNLHEGIYAGLIGPVYETPAEIRMLRSLGADLVGMSTVLEALAAHYLGARVLGISMVSNKAAGLSPAPLSHEEVAAAGKLAAGRLEKLLRDVIGRFGQ
jgi:purine-nucleoside phosphorylase